jgi:glycosyltransferase involved in cell wall biosynthesis
MNKIKFSVLLPVYFKDNPLFFNESIGSLFSQTLLPNEIVIIKDGPINEEINIAIKQYVDLKIIPIIEYQFEKNVGTGIAFAKGVEICNYEYIARMDADDICRKDRFEKQISFMNKNPHIDIVSSNIIEFLEDINFEKSIKKVPEFHNDIVKFAKRRSPFNHPVVVFKKSVVLKSGNYQSVGCYEDYDLWIRIFLVGGKGYNLQDTLLYFRTSNQMYLRRGGLKNAIQEVQALNRFFIKYKFYNLIDFFINLIIRISVRLLPNFFRKFFYEKILR